VEAAEIWAVGMVLETVAIQISKGYVAPAKGVIVTHTDIEFLLNVTGYDPSFSDALTVSVQKVVLTQLLDSLIKWEILYEPPRERAQQISAGR
jgi:hypothetical protein